MKRCIVVCGGEMCQLPKQLEHLDEEDFVVACDSGYDHCLRFGIQTNLVVGDMDSVIAPLPREIECIRLNCEKDDTDTMTAVKIGFERGYTQFLLVAALGGRLDHAFANLQTLCYIQQHGGEGSICSHKEVVYLLSCEEKTISYMPHTTLSVFTPDAKAVGVTIQGAKYPLDNATMTNSFPIGVSNEFLTQPVTISVKEGRLFIILTDKNFA